MFYQVKRAIDVDLKVEQWSYLWKCNEWGNGRLETYWNKWSVWELLYRGQKRFTVKHLSQSEM